MKPEVLLKAFVLHQSEDGFRELVATTVDAVYSSALSIVHGPPHLVEEVVLRVYWELARKARTLGEKIVLETWLREHTCKAATKVLREADRSVDRAAVKRERGGLSASESLHAAPPGLATRISQSILLNSARCKSFWHFLPRAFWPSWIRPVHIGGGAVCLLAIIALGHVPLHKRNPIIESPDLELTPASFGQLARSEEGNGPQALGITVNTNAESKVRQR